MFVKNYLVLCLVFVLNGCMAAVLGGSGAVGYGVAQERSFGTAVDDTTISAQIHSAFVQSDVNNLLPKVGVEVHEGRVLLTGVVQKVDHRVEAVRLAWQPRGVKEVINEIQVAEKPSAKIWGQDAWITAQVKGQLLKAKNVRSVNYSVETVNGTVYLIGLANSQAELEEATRVASIVKGVKQVISHIRIASGA